MTLVTENLQTYEGDHILKCFFFFSLSLWLWHSDVTQLKKEVDELVDAIIENFFEPEKNKLQPKAD